MLPVQQQTAYRKLVTVVNIVSNGWPETNEHQCCSISAGCIGNFFANMLATSTLKDDDVVFIVCPTDPMGPTK